MIAHLTVTPLSASLAGRAILRGLDRGELDATPAERDQLQALAATLGASLDVGFTGVQITIDDPVRRVMAEDAARRCVFGGAGVI